MTSLANSQPNTEQHAPLIRWPCEGLPYDKTIRARYWFRYRALLPAAFFVPMVLSPIWIAYALNSAFPKHWSGPLFVFVPPGGLLLWIVWYLLFVRPLRTAAKQSRTNCEAWRTEWKRLERQSNELKARIASFGQIAPVALLAENPVQGVPGMPPSSWYLTDQTDLPLGQIQMPNDGDVAARSRACSDAIYSYMVMEIVACGGHSVVGFSTLNGQEVLCACFMVRPNVQLWVRFTVRCVGNTLSTDIRTGHHWWAPPGEVIQGGHYRGDVASARLALLLPKEYTYPVNTVLWTVFFPIGAIIYWIMVAFTLWGIVEELRTRHFTANIRYECGPAAGDSSDIWVMEEIRRRKRHGFGVSLNDNAKAELESLSRRLILGAQRAASMKGVLD